MIYTPIQLFQTQSQTQKKEQEKMLNDEWEMFCDEEMDMNKYSMTLNSNTFHSHSNITSSNLNTTSKQSTNELKRTTLDTHEQIQSGNLNLNVIEPTPPQTPRTKDQPIPPRPKCGDIYISTKTNISYFNQPIDLHSLFWKIPLIPYYQAQEGIIKKQMKFNSTTQEELRQLEQHIEQVKDEYIEQYIITSLHKPSGRMKFKDVRKISIGISKKDILSYRSKKRGAFYNCFVVIMRVYHDQENNGNGIFKEVHIKVFNTGKMEIPGIQDSTLLNSVLIKLTTLLKTYMQPQDKDGMDNTDYQELEYVKERTETVLINSNFSCGYYIQREKLYELLKYKYNLNCVYDPCSYPGIQCEFHHNPMLLTQTGKQQTDAPTTTTTTTTPETKKVKISFMIFRTGSVLIVGKCNEQVLIDTYLFLKNILETEYEVIYNGLIKEQTQEDRDKEQRKKIRKTTILTR
jgi:hypothetical protein